MTPQERLAALKMLRTAIDGLIKASPSHPYTTTLHHYPHPTLWKEIRALSYDLWLDGIGGIWLIFNTPSKNQAKRLRTKVRNWLDAEIAKLEQLPADRSASALPYKLLLNSMDSRMGYDDEEKQHWLLVNTDGNDSQMLFHDIGEELTKSTGAILRIVDMNSLYMLFKTKTKFDSEAREIEGRVVAWLKNRIAEIEQQAAEPMPNPFTQEGRDEILQNSQQSPKDDLMSVVRESNDFYMATINGLLNQLLGKDEEIARLKKDNDNLFQQHLSRDKAVTQLRFERDAKINLLQSELEKSAKNLEDATAFRIAREVEKDEEIAALKKQIEMMTPVADRPVMPRLPKVGDVILVTRNTQPALSLRAVIFHMEEGYFWLIVDERCGEQAQMDIKEYGRGWIYADSSAAVPKDVDQPALKTAADAQVGDKAWSMDEGERRAGVISKLLAGAVEIVVYNSFGHICFSVTTPLDWFGIGWGFVEDTK